MARVQSIIDLFAGHGWDVAARQLGLPDPLGIEWDAAACATREAAGMPTLQADIAALEPLDFGLVTGLIASPPCQSFSGAGKGGGKHDQDIVIRCAYELAAGLDSRPERAAECQDPRSLLTVEPLRWALALRPLWIAFEQVPAVLPLWQLFADILYGEGYAVDAGVLHAEQFGHNPPRWVHGRPSTTVCADPRIMAPGRHDPKVSGSQMKDAVRVTVEEAACLQSYPAGFPFRGSKTKQYQQIGNAVPVLLAKAVLKEIAL